MRICDGSLGKIRDYLSDVAVYNSLRLIVNASVLLAWLRLNCDCGEMILDYYIDTVSITLHYTRVKYLVVDVV